MIGHPGGNQLHGHNPFAPVRVNPKLLPYYMSIVGLFYLAAHDQTDFVYYDTSIRCPTGIPAELRRESRKCGNNSNMELLLRGLNDSIQCAHSLPRQV